MNPCPVSTDLMRYDRQCELADIESEMEEQRIEDMKSEYWKEYLDTGRIDDLDLDEAELEFMSQEQNIDFEQIIYNECAEIVRVTWG